MLPLLIALLQVGVAAPGHAKRPVETLALIDQARALAPEFSADILLRVADSRLVNDRKWKQELIEEAFLTGGRAPLPYRQHGETQTDTRSARAVWDNKLDALSLQTRAVDLMLAIDPQRARALFEDIIFPQAPPRTCADVLRPDVSAYQAAASIFERGFTQIQRDKEDHLVFLERIAGSVQSPVHVGPTIRLILTLQLTTAQRQALAGTFAAALDRIEGADRSSVASAANLVPSDTAALRSVASLLMPALRTYLVHQLRAPRCRGAFEIRQEGMPVVLAGFNQLAKALDPAGGRYQPISAEECHPIKEEEGYVQQP